MLPVLARHETPAVTMGLEAEAGKPGQRLEAREAGGFALPGPLEEEPAQGHLLAGTVGDGPLRHRLTDHRQRLALVGIADAEGLLLPGRDPLFQRRVVELLMAAQQCQQQGSLLLGGVELVAHLALCCDLHHIGSYEQTCIKHPTSLRLWTQLPLGSCDQIP